MARKSQKDAILDAAEKVIGGQGLIHTTLDAVAAEAGISKGGLLYHFSCKKDLIFTLIERHHKRMVKRVEELKKTLPDTPGRDLKALILAKLTDPSRLSMSASKMAGALEDDDLRELVTDIKKQEISNLEKICYHREMSTVVVLAMEGLWMMDLFKIPAFNAEFRDRVIAEMLEMADKSCLRTA